MRIYVCMLIAVAILYSAVVVASGAGWNLFGVQWNFTNSGQFGDSFGPFSAVMSSIAAISAFLAYRSQREELRRVKTSAEQDRASNERRDFEGTFFKLLEIIRNTVRDTDVRAGRSDAKSGTDAFEAMTPATMYWDEDITSDKIAQIYKNTYKHNQKDLGHYFRLCYHIVKYIDESSLQNKMIYIRIFRATLSNPELILIGLNCCYGGGRVKFKPLIEKYAVLHNVSAREAIKFKLHEHLGEGAFGDRDIMKSPDEID